LLGQWIDAIAEAGGSSYTFHLEALSDPETQAANLISHIHSKGMKAALAISPDTPSTAVTDKMGEGIDMILVMTVHPGKGGQKFIEHCMEKVCSCAHYLLRIIEQGI